MIKTGLLREAAERKRFDHFFLMVLSVSLFLPVYFSGAVTCAIAVMTMMNYKKRARAFSSPYTKYLLGFLIVPFFVSATYNNYWGMLCSIMMLAMVICGFYVRSVMTRPLFNRMMDLACAASLGSAAVAVCQKIAYYATAPNYRPVSTFINANYYGMMIEFVIIIAVYRIFTNPRRRGLYFAVIAANLGGLYLCASLSSFAAAAAAVLFMLLWKRKYRAAAGLLLAIGLFACVGLAFPQVFPRGIPAVDNTCSQRLSIWTTALKGIRRHPLMGTGPMSYLMIYDQFGGYQTFHSHNLLLDILLNFGFVGLTGFGFYAAVQVRILILRFRNNLCNSMNLLLAAAAVAVVVHGLTDVTIFWIQTGLLFLLIFSSTGIGAEYLERKLRVPSLVPDYSDETVSRPAFLKN